MQCRLGSKCFVILRAILYTLQIEEEGQSGFIYHHAPRVPLQFKLFSCFDFFRILIRVRPSPPQEAFIRLNDVSPVTFHLCAIA